MENSTPFHEIDRIFSNLDCRWAVVRAGLLTGHHP